MNTLDVIQNIIQNNPKIAMIRLVTYEPQKDIAEDFSTSWTQLDEAYYIEALDIRTRIKLPFWNSLMLALIHGNAISKNCLLGTSKHNQITEIGWFPANSIVNANSISFPYNRKGINSTVRLCNGKKMHIPMLDFHIDISEKNTNLVKNVCNILGMEGYILNSGKSYHFIGINLISQNKLIEFLGRALLFTPIVDEIWIAHQLQERSCTLRYGEKYGICPTVMLYIDGRVAD